MSENHSEQLLKLPSKKAITWLVTEGILILLGMFIGINLTNDQGPAFLLTFIYPHYHPTGVSDVALTNYFMVIPSIVFCLLLWGLALWHKVAWWKPLGFFVGYIGISLWWINQFNYYSYFSGRP